MKRSNVTKTIQQLSQAGKTDYEISVQLSLDITKVRNRVNYLVRRGELQPKRANRTKFLQSAAAQGIPEYYAAHVYRLCKSGKTALDGDALLELWISQGGKCALTGRPFTEEYATSPVVVLVPYADNPIVIGAAINNLRGTLTIPLLVKLCKLVASNT
jgi:hypothetical protein